MPLSTRLTLPALLAFMPALAADASATKPVAATVETTLATAAGRCCLMTPPPVAVCKYPIEFVVNADDAPDLKEWAEKTARVGERQFPMICEELKSDGFKPLTVITMRLRNDYNGVAAAGGG